MSYLCVEGIFMRDGDIHMASVHIDFVYLYMTTKSLQIFAISLEAKCLEPLGWQRIYLLAHSAFAEAPKKATLLLTCSLPNALKSKICLV